MSIGTSTTCRAPAPRQSSVTVDLARRGLSWNGPRVRRKTTRFLTPLEEEDRSLCSDRFPLPICSTQPPQVLHGLPRNGLSSAWILLHQLRRHAPTPRIPVLPSRISACQRVAPRSAVHLWARLRLLEVLALANPSSRREARSRKRSRPGLVLSCPAKGNIAITSTKSEPRLRLRHGVMSRRTSWMMLCTCFRSRSLQFPASRIPSHLGMEAGRTGLSPSPLIFQTKILPTQ
jgi:hypothetical protein